MNKLMFSIMLCLLLTAAGCQAASDGAGGEPGAAFVSDDARDTPADSAQTPAPAIPNSNGADATGAADADTTATSATVIDPQAWAEAFADAGAAMSAALMTYDGDTLVIQENLFKTQYDEIIYNHENYLGKTVKYEGIFFVGEETEDMELGEYAVARYGPGCCANDKYVGFGVAWNKKYPQNNDWVEAVGVLDSYEDEYGYIRLFLKLSSLTVLDARGTEAVVE